MPRRPFRPNEISAGGVVVRRYYADLLHRGASAAEVNGWVSMPLDLLSIEVQFAASGEFQANG